MAEIVRRYNNLIKVVHTLECDRCKVEMVQDQFILTTLPVQYTYHCPACGDSIQTFTSYPYVKYVGELIEDV